MLNDAQAVWLAAGLRTPFVQGSRAIVSICSDGGLGTVALLER